MRTKNYILISLITLFSLQLSAQEGRMKRPDQDKIKAFKIAYITDKLDLTAEEAQQFWPIYNEHEKKMEELRKQENAAIKKYIKERSDIVNISEEQAREIVTSVRKIEKLKEEQSERTFNKMKRILPYKKILKLQVAEREFKRNLLRKLKKRRKQLKEPKEPK